MLDKNGYTGYLVVNTRMANGAIPVEGARVRVTEADEGTGNTAAVEITDNSGMTKKIALAAPSPQFSEKPNEQTRPYSIYNIEITKDGFYDIIKLNVPIYSGITAIQPVEMLPLPVGSNGYSKSEIFQENFPPEL